jgi:hypothetical protein
MNFPKGLHMAMIGHGFMGRAHSNAAQNFTHFYASLISVGSAMRTVVGRIVRGFSNSSVGLWSEAHEKRGLASELM